MAQWYEASLEDVAVHVPIPAGLLAIFLFRFFAFHPLACFIYSHCWPFLASRDFCDNVFLTSFSQSESGCFWILYQKNRGQLQNNIFFFCGGVINLLFDGLAYNTSGHFAHCSYLHILYTRQSQNIRTYYMLNHRIRCMYWENLVLVLVFVLECKVLYFLKLPERNGTNHFIFQLQ